MSTILQVGNFGVSHASEVHWAKSFQALGHTVIPLQENTVGEAEAFAGLERADLLVVTRCWGWPAADWLAPLIARAQRAGIPSCGLHLDRFFGLPRINVLTTDPMFRTDVVFTPDGGPHPWAAYGVNHHWLPAGVFADECYDARHDETYATKRVGFIGSYGYHPEWPHRAQLVEHLADWYGDEFVLIPGNGNPALRGDDLNRAYASLDVTVGDSCFVSREGRYTSDRVYEAWGRGGFLIHPGVLSMEDELGPTPGRMWDAGDWPMLKECIDGWLGDDTARHRTQARLAKVVRESCTYRDRLVELLSVMGVSERRVAA